MTIQSEKILFVLGNLSVIPDKPGVYGLYQAGQTIYYGKSSNSIRDRVENHMHGREGPCTHSADMFNWEEMHFPERREEQLLQEYRRFYGRLPRCNDRLG